MLYIWLSIPNANIITNDKFNIYIRNFQENKYLNNCWKEFINRHKILFEFIDGKFIEILQHNNNDNNNWFYSECDKYIIFLL